MSTTRPDAPIDLDDLLRRLDRLPSLSAIAVRLLQVTSSDDASAREVVGLLEADPALAASILKACRCSERGRSARINSIERAVVLVGFKAVRSIALSVQFFELLDGLGRSSGVFDRRLFWRHCLAVSVAAEHIARGAGTGVDPAEAGLAGLLHDLGHLALHATARDAFDSVCASAERTGESIDALCRRVFSTDTHTIGRRLAERWSLPEPIVEAIWLGGGAAPTGAGPAGALVAVVSLADQVARQQQICHPGHGPTGLGAAIEAERLGITTTAVEAASSGLHRAVSERAAALGLGEEPTEALLLTALGRANQALARMNGELRDRGDKDRPLTHGAELAQRFLSDLDSRADRSVGECLGAIAKSAAALLRLTEVSIVRTPRGGQPWRLDRFAADGRQLAGGSAGSATGNLPIDEARLRRLAAQLLRREADDDAELILLSHQSRVEAAIATPADRMTADARGALRLLAPLWAGALAAAQRHEDALRLAERLAEGNRAVSEAQDALARARALASLGEMTAGAAHEMNNPLAVICGRAQLLAEQVQDPDQRRMAQQIAEQAARLSDLVTALRQCAEPVELRRAPASIAQIVRSAIAGVGRRDSKRVTLTVDDDGVINADAPRLAEALTELLRNALAAAPDMPVAVRVQTDPVDGRWILHVADRGPGLSARALAHAFDPFFSEQEAGRRPGLGLARARRLIEAHGGRINLRNGPDSGAVATIVLPAATRLRQRGRDVA